MAYQLHFLQVPQDVYNGPPLGGPTSRSLKDRLIRKLNGGFQLREDVYQEPHFHFDPTVFDRTIGELLRWLFPKSFVFSRCRIFYL